MENAIFQYEIKQALKAPLFYFLALLFFLFSGVTMLGTGGFFDEPISSTVNVNLLNTPFALTNISFLFSKFLLFVVAILAGGTLYKDYKNKTHSILYTFPISKNYYLGGKLLSALFLVTMMTCITFLGVGFGEKMLGVSNPKITELNISGYVVSVGVYLLPTLLVIGTFVFVAIGFTRNVFSGFIVVICFALFQMILENIFFNQPTLLAFIDPFGQNAFYRTTKDWDFDLQNSSSLPIDWVVMLNRMFWISIAFFIYYVLYRKFDFQYDSIFPQKTKDLLKKEKNPTRENTLLNSPVQFDFSWMAKCKAVVFLLLFDLKSMLKNGMFIFLSFFGVLTIFFIQLRMSSTGDFVLFPNTRMFLGAPLSIYSLIIIFSTFLFSGLLLNKASQYKMDAIVDINPTGNWQFIISKIGALSALQLVQLLLFLFVSLGVQCYNQYYNFEIELYLFHLLILVFPVLLVWNFTSVFIHSFFQNVYLGLFVLACIWLGSQSFEQIGINTSLLKYNTLPHLEYSDFNGYGSQLEGYYLLLMYWLSLGFLVLLSSFLIWRRGNITSLKERLGLMKSRVNVALLVVGFIFIANFLILGNKIYQAEKMDKNNNIYNQIDIEEFKKEWEAYSSLTQPKIIDIDLALDLFPEENRFEAEGKYILKNKTNIPIDTIYLRTGFDEISKIEWGGKAKLIKEDKSMENYLYELDQPLLLGDSIEFHFQIKNSPNTCFTQNSNVLSNGTYMLHDILPRLEYQFDEQERSLNDSMVHDINYFHKDADYLNLRTKISTSGEQIAIAPGDLISKENKNGRNYFEYQTPHPVKLNFSFISASFEKTIKEHKGISIELFHHKNHGENTSFMIEGLKAALEFNTKYFGSYPYQNIRIIEFPHTGKSYSATLTANNIPTSEILFNMNAESMKDKLNLPFYVMAHELTHEWFGNQVMPADAPGAKMLTESMTEYITLCIYRSYLGEEIAHDFLKLQKQRYENGKKKEKGEEMPLYKVKDHQEYISYGKGAIAFHTLAHKIGEEKMFSILKEYINQYKYKNTYPTTLDFIRIMKKNTDVQFHPSIEKWLMEIHLIQF